MPAEQQDIPLAVAILQHIKTTLETVQEGEDYAHTLEVERLKKRGNTPRDQLALIVRGPFRPAGEEAVGHSDRILTVYVICYAAVADDSDEEVEDRLLEIEADVEKALCKTESSYTRGGLAIATELTDGIPFDDEESGLSGSVLILDIHHRSGKDDQYYY